ncbi:hypothetical protein O3M35_007897 [Rhynocoris fuscipes]|uniref:Peptidase A1 domain-containing protein n=1 Tax=Rhynocoris fuscipes TaxID=488301 RepID=A0AAW1DDI7_9HEMI
MIYFILFWTLINYLCLNVNSFVRVPLQRDHYASLEKSINAKENAGNINGTVTALKLKYGERSSGFIGTISIGTPKNEQVFNMVIDISNTALWVISSECTTEICRNHNVYTYEWSKTYESNDRFKSIKDGKDKLLGLGAKDVVQIGSVSVKSVPFYLVKDLPIDFLLEKTYDGRLGLSLPINDDDETILETMINQGTLEWNLFSLYINRTKEPNFTYSGGELMLGGWNTKYFNPDDIDYIPLSKPGKWQFTIDRITSAENTTGVWCKSGCEATVSSTYQFIEGPAKEIKAIYQYIGASIDFPLLPPNTPIVKCNQINQLPPIKFHINKKEYILESTDYVVQTGNPEYCLMALIIADNSSDPWKIGYRFLSKYYTIFNASEKKIAFANLK